MVSFGVGFVDGERDGGYEIEDDGKGEGGGDIRIPSGYNSGGGSQGPQQQQYQQGGPGSGLGQIGDRQVFGGKDMASVFRCDHCKRRNVECDATIDKACSTCKRRKIRCNIEGLVRPTWRKSTGEPGVTRKKKVPTVPNNPNAPVNPNANTVSPILNGSPPNGVGAGNVIPVPAQVRKEGEAEEGFGEDSSEFRANKVQKTTNGSASIEVNEYTLPGTGENVAVVTNQT